MNEQLAAVEAVRDRALIRLGVLAQIAEERRFSPPPPEWRRQWEWSIEMLKAANAVRAAVAAADRRTEP